MGVRNYGMLIKNIKHTQDEKRVNQALNLHLFN